MKIGTLETKKKGIPQRLMLCFMQLVGAVEALVYGKVSIFANNPEDLKIVNVHIHKEMDWTEIEKIVKESVTKRFENPIE